MATFTWEHGTTADWRIADDWSGKRDDTPPPGSISSATDIANLGADRTAYTVTVGTGETFDIATLNIAGESNNAPTGLDISGALLTNTVAYGGGGNDAAIAVFSGGVLDIRASIAASDNETLTIAGTGAGGHLEFGSAINSGTGINDARVTFSFSNGLTGPNAGEIEFNGPIFTKGSTTNQTIIGVAAGDRFVFDHADFTSDVVSFENGTLTVTDAANNTVLTMNNLSMAAGATPAFQAFGDTIEETTACYVAGTGILTPSGEVPIENLAIGDLVTTRSGEARPIKWIGRRSYQGRFIAGNRDVLPIRIAAGALADGIPQRDLDVSPKHAMFIDSVLVPAEMLLNGTSIYPLHDGESVEYFHLELASHDVVIANGAASESFVDCDSRGMFHNALDYARRYPDDPGPAWQFCAPRVEGASAALVEIRARLMARAGSPERFCPPETLKGSIDLCDRIRVSGWVFDPANPTQRVRLEVRCGGDVIGHVVADRYRHDLAKVGYLGDGCCSYDFLHPIRLNPLSAHTIELRRVGDGAPVPGSPVLLSAPSGFNAECRSGVARMLNEVTQTATTPSELDDIIRYWMAEAEALLAARARLDAGARADVMNIRERWGGLVPTASVQRAVPELRPQALFIDDQYPAAGMNGGASAAMDHMRALMRIGFEVSFVASQDLADASQRGAALATLGIKPLSAPWYGSVEEVLRRHAGRIDVIYLHRAGNAAAYSKLARQYSPRALLVYGVADLHHVRLARQGSVENRPEITRRAERLQVEEMVTARLADVVITHSNAEAALLRACVPGVRVAVVPWSVPLRTSTRGFAERKDVVFVGYFRHEPNVDAVQWLAQKIVPLVRQQDPTIGFRIVGNDMPDSLRRLAQPGLDLIGSVETLDALLDETRLTVAPLRYGAGLKAKVLESLAAGVPCVGTSIAFEGMTLPPALTGCVADTPAAFATALVRLYRDEAAHAIAATAGQRYALTNCSEACVDAQMQQALAPALRRWAGIAEDAREDAPALQMAG
jgi:glycosyltransferase involved in cell wall biosynthesis